MPLPESRRKSIFSHPHEILSIRFGRLGKHRIKETVPELVNSIGLQFEVQVL
jgi:hypothetical protein